MSSFTFNLFLQGRRSRGSTAMEACFLTSNSFPKSFESAFYTIKRRNFQQSRAISFQFRRQKPAITSCRLESSSSSSRSEDGGEIVINSDWRSFRAKLVAGQKSSRSEVPVVPVDPDTVVDRPPSVVIGEKWAHAIHEPEKGCLLVATEKLDGVHIFERTVILILSTGPLGPSGIILNRPSLMSIKETRSTALDISGTFSDRPLFFGGPLEEGLFLVEPKGGDDDLVGRSGVFEEVMKGLYYGSRESVGCGSEMVKRNVVGVEDFRFFDGYCGWEMEQLREEIKAGYWTVAACSSSVVGLSCVGSVGLWEEVLGLIGPRKFGQIGL